MITETTPPKSALGTLIKKAYSARYGMDVSIRRDGLIKHGDAIVGHMDDHHTTRTASLNVRLYSRHGLLFTFNPEI